MSRIKSRGFKPKSNLDTQFNVDIQYLFTTDSESKDKTQR